MINAYAKGLGERCREINSSRWRGPDSQKLYLPHVRVLPCKK